jgi:hypothetical protein
MSQFVLDDQLSASAVLEPIAGWLSACRLRDLRPGQLIRDDRIPEILLTLRQPTFITIDGGFWDKALCHPGYCIIYFPLRDDQQGLLVELLRQALRRPELRTRRARMGKVARLSPARIQYWQFAAAPLHTLSWKPRQRQKRKRP